MSKIKNHFYDLINTTPSAIYSDVTDVDYISDEFECTITDQQVYEAELLSDYLRDTARI